MADYLTTDTELTSIANAIRTKGGTSASLEYPTDFVTAIGNIQTGTDDSDATLNSNGQLLNGVTAYSKGTKYTGNIPSKSSSDLTASVLTVTAPSGYYASNATKTLADSNLVAGNIKNGTTIFGVTGTYSGGGGSGLTLLGTSTLGSLSTSSTTATDTGKSFTINSVTDYDVLVVDISVGTVTNSRHIGTISMVYLTGTSNVDTKNTVAVGSNKWNIKAGSTGTKSTRQSTSAYGVYINAGTLNNGNITLTVYYRYNSNNTGTINGSYTAHVYGLKLVDLV